MTTQNSTHLEVLATIKVKDRNHWTRIGAAFPTKDGTGFRLKLDYVPRDPATEIVILPPKDRDVED